MRKYRKYNHGFHMLEKAKIGSCINHVDVSILLRAFYQNGHFTKLSEKSPNDTDTKQH